MTGPKNRQAPDELVITVQSHPALLRRQLRMPPLVNRLPPEISLPTAEPVTMAGAVVQVLSLFLLARSGWRTFLLAFVLLLPLVAFHAFGVLTHQVVRPSTIADRVEAPDGSAAFYALHQPGMPDDSQVICIQRSVLSGCDVIDAWQSQQPCKNVLPAYVAVYMAGNIASVGSDASPIPSLRRKCG